MAAASYPSPPHPEPARGRLRGAQRTGKGAMLAGVCAGLARAYDVDPRLLRVAFIVLALLTGGAALCAYVVAWVVLPSEPGAPSGLHSLGWRTGAGAGLLAAAAVLALQQLGALPDGASFFWPVVLTTGGVVLLLRAGSHSAPRSVDLGGATGGAPRHPGRFPELPDLPGIGPRMLAGVALIVTGFIALLGATSAIGTVRNLLVAALIVLAGVTLIFGSSWLGLLSTLREERAQRIRSDERAELAASCTTPCCRRSR